MKLFSVLQLALLNLFSNNPLSGEEKPYSPEVREHDINVLSVMIANRNNNSVNPAFQLVRTNNTILDLSKLVVATFEPEGEAPRLKLVFTGSPEMLIQGEEAANLWRVLASRVKA